MKYLGIKEELGVNNSNPDNYYTKPESDGKYLAVEGGTLTGPLSIQDGSNLEEISFKDDAGSPIFKVKNNTNRIDIAFRGEGGSEWFSGASISLINSTVGGNVVLGTWDKSVPSLGPRLIARGDGELTWRDVSIFNPKPIAVTLTSGASGSIVGYRIGKMGFLEFIAVSSPSATLGTVDESNGSITPQFDSMWCTVSNPTQSGILQITSEGLLKAYNYPSSTLFFGSIVYPIK